MLNQVKLVHGSLLFLVLILSSCYKPVQVNFTTDKDSYFRGETIHTINQTQNAWSYSWSYEGQASAEASPSFPIPETYAPGQYEVILTATGRRDEDVQSMSKKITVMNGGRVTVWTGLPLKENIQIFVDDKTVGTLNTSLKNAPGCGGSGSVSTFLSPGTHRLTGKTSDHTWKGTFTVEQDECLLFEID